MKFLFLLLIYNLVVAQPVLIANDINFTSLSYNIYNSSGLTLPPVSPSGPDQIWNYSDLTLDLFSTSVSTIVNTAPFYNNFSNANFL